MKIDDEVLGVLSACTADGNALTLPEQLHRKLYERVDKVLKLLRGKWDRKRRAHIFDEPTIGMVERVMLLGEATDAKKELDFFETPEALAHDLVIEASVEPGMRCLEPSAGRGRIAAQLSNVVGLSNVVCIEIMSENVKALSSAGFGVHASDFFEMTHLGLPPFDRVVMNPPFARQADIDHVAHAFRFLKKDGVLVSVMSAGVEFRQDRKATGFREFIAARGGEIRRLPSGSFKASGTMVETVVVKVTA